MTLPPSEYADAWDVLVDTGGGAVEERTFAAGDRLKVQHRSTVVLREHHEPAEEVDHSVAASLASYGGNSQ